ncbi:hypothetical protein NDU88_004025 [Pleurodeles waltl]|uniref:Uncharacterized protein n=1 Tax=Pleurodeles waltl TaxID=8319 RepID=A0AAV7MW26_PLEWA|nr:hypothetical protein NDU88_004025 [Pleurodeles waltl]
MAFLSFPKIRGQRVLDPRGVTVAYQSVLLKKQKSSSPAPLLCPWGRSRCLHPCRLEPRCERAEANQPVILNRREQLLSGLSASAPWRELASGIRSGRGRRAFPSLRNDHLAP